MDEYENGKRSQVEFVKPPEFIPGLDLQSLSLCIEFLQFNLVKMSKQVKFLQLFTIAFMKTDFMPMNDLFGSLRNNVPFGLLKLEKQSVWQFQH